MVLPTDSRTPRPLVLVVDDEVQILSALRRTLRRERFDLVTAETPQEGLRILEERSVSLLVSDHKMPGMSGLQFLEKVEARQPNLPKMVITGWTEEIPESELERLGICALITKPWEDAKLKATLRRALSLES